MPARRGKRTRVGAVVAAFLLVAGIGLVGSAPAEAAGTSSVGGSIKCTAYPVITVGTSATARGAVTFSINKYGNTGTLESVKVGSSSAYVPWGWKFWTGQAGTFTATGAGTNGGATGAKRYCQNMFS